MEHAGHANGIYELLLRRRRSNVVTNLGHDLGVLAGDRIAESGEKRAMRHAAVVLAQLFTTPIEMSVPETLSLRPSNTA